MKRSHQSVMLWLTAVGLAGALAVPLRAESWLTPSELEFIAALGLDAKINGRAYHRRPNYDALSDIAARAPEPLKTRILAMAKASPKISLSPDQVKEFQTLLLSAAGKAREQLRSVALSGKSAAEAVNVMLEDDHGPFRVAWRKQTEWYLEKANARETIAKNMNLVTADFEKRIHRKRPKSDLSLTLGAENGTLVIKGKAASSFTAAVVQVVIHKAKANGSWQKLNLVASGMLRRMGVSSMNSLSGAAAKDAAAMTAAQEKAFNLPIVKTFGLPRLRPGSRLTLDLDEDLNDVIFFERISLKVWTAEGTLTLDSIPSIEAVQKLREEVPRDERFKDTAGKKPVSRTASTRNSNKANNSARTSNRPMGLVSPALGGSVPQIDLKLKAQLQAQQEQQALSALNFARSAMAKKQNNQAKIFLNQAIILAPNSPAAKTARTLLKKLGQ